MRILFLANNWVAWKVGEWLRKQGAEIVGLVVHPLPRSKYRSEIIAGVGLDDSRIFDGSQLHRPEVMEAIRALQPKIGLSVFFGYICCRELLDLLPAGCINIHPGMLPYNRGAYPNIWSIVERTPAGVSIHFLDQDIDTGDIIAQRQVTVEPTDTGLSLYRKLEEAAVELFKETWPLLLSGRVARTPQDKSQGTLHRVKDIERIDRIELDATYTARELIDLLRARTFPPHAGAYFLNRGEKVYLRLQLLKENDLQEGESDE